MAVLAATRHNPGLQRVFRWLTAASNSHKLALVAIMRKLSIPANVPLSDARHRAETRPAGRT